MSAYEGQIGYRYQFTHESQTWDWTVGILTLRVVKPGGAQVVWTPTVEDSNNAYHDSVAGELTAGEWGGQVWYYPVDLDSDPQYGGEFTFTVLELKK